MNKHITPLLAIVILLALLACNTEPATEEEKTEAAEIAVAMDTLSGIFEGTMPCADCEGIHSVLEIYPQRIFALRTTYIKQENGQDRTVIVIGNWEPAADNIIVFRSGNTTRKVRFVDQVTLRLLSRNGEEIPNPDEHILLKSEYLPGAGTPRSHLGLYYEVEGAQRIVLCGNQVTYPVIFAEGAETISEEYKLFRKQPSQTMLVWLKGHREMGEAPEGDGAVEHFKAYELIGFFFDKSECPKFMVEPEEEM